MPRPAKGCSIFLLILAYALVAKILLVLALRPDEQKHISNSKLRNHMQVSGNITRMHSHGQSGTADLDQKLMYMGSAEDEKYDQVLKCVMIGPFNTVGNYRFIFQVMRPILLHWPSIVCLRGCQTL